MLSSGQEIAVGRFGSAYGIKGWIKVISYTDPIDNILKYLPWYIKKADKFTAIDLIQGKLHGGNLVVQIKQSQDRDIARTFTNLEIYVEKSQLPALGNGEFYWIDLIGLEVINLQDEHLGLVDHLFETGANDVLVTKDQFGEERYIPYIDAVIKQVDIANKKMLVDWDANF